MSEAPSIDRFWEGFLGSALRAGITVVPHAAGLAGYSGVWFFVREAACVVSVPAPWCERLEAALAGSTIDALLSGDGLRALFGDAFDRTIGPSWQGWLPPERFRPALSPSGRIVREATAAEIQDLRDRAPAADRDAADLRDDGALGCFAAADDSGRELLLAASSMTPWSDGVVGPGVLSLRAGCGKLAVSAVCTRSLAAGQLVVYQTLRENERAVGLARSLGFEYYASHLAVRLREV